MVEIGDVGDMAGRQSHCMRERERMEWREIEKGVYMGGRGGVGGNRTEDLHVEYS